MSEGRFPGDQGMIACPFCGTPVAEGERINCQVCGATATAGNSSEDAEENALTANGPIKRSNYATRLVMIRPDAYFLWSKLLERHLI